MMSALMTPLRKSTKDEKMQEKKLVLLVMKEYINKNKGLNPSTREVYEKHNKMKRYNRNFQKQQTTYF